MQNFIYTNFISKQLINKLERDISSRKAKIKTLVIPTNEELEIAKQSYQVYKKK